MSTKPLKPQIYTNATDKTVIRIMPKLAEEIGLNESIVLLQVSFWIGHYDNLKDGKWWVYKSTRDMIKDAFPFWSVMTCNRAINNLIDKGLLIASNEHNSKAYDKTRWFTLNTDKLSELKSIAIVLEDENGKATLYQNDTTLYQNDTTLYQNDTTLYQNDTTIQEIKERDIKKELTKGDSKSSKQKSIHPDFDEMCNIIKSELKQYNKSTREKIAKALLGCLNNGSSEYNLDVPITPNELEEFICDWDKKIDRNGNRLIRPKNLGSIKTNVTIWQEQKQAQVQKQIDYNSVFDLSASSNPNHH